MTAAVTDGHDRAGRRGVADPHLADADRCRCRDGSQVGDDVADRPRWRRNASSRVIAGPSVMSAVPARMRARIRRPPRSASRRSGAIGPGDADVDDGRATPGRAARTLIAAPPPTKLATIWAVTSGGRRRRPARDAVVGGRDDDRAAGDRGDRLPGDAGQRRRRAPRGGRGCRAAWSADRGWSRVAAIAAASSGAERGDARPGRRRGVERPRRPSSARPPFNVTGRPATSSTASSAIAASRWWAIPTRSR